MKQRRRIYYSAAQRAEIWDRVAEALRPDDHRDPYGVAEAKRLLARPSMARAVDEARPYRA